MRILVIGGPRSVHPIRWANRLQNKENTIFYGFFHGDQRVYSKEALLLTRADHTVKVDILGKRNRIPILRNLIYNFEMNKYIRFQGWRIKALRKYIVENKIEVILSHSLNYFSYIAVGNKIVPVVAVAWGSEVHRSKAKEFDQVKYSIMHANAVQCTGGDMVERVFEISETVKIGYFSWGVDVNKFRPLSDLEISEISTKFNLQKNKASIFFMRGMKKVYRGELITECVKILLNNPGIYVIIRVAGASKTIMNDLYDLQEHYYNLKLIDQILSDKENETLVAFADICVSVPTSDQRSSSVLEAMSSGNVVVSSYLPSYSDLFALPGVIQANLDDPTSFATQLTNITEEVDIEKDGMANRNFIIEKENMDTANIQMFELLKSVTNSNLKE